MVTRKRVWIAVLSLLAIEVVGTVVTQPPEPDPVNHPLLVGAQIDPALLSVIRIACQDCHSENTHYLWYSNFFPVSWWTEDHVSGGRRHLDLSKWSDYPLARKQKLLDNIAKQVRNGDMPLSSYTLIHRDARLSAADVNAIVQWTQAESARLATSPAVSRSAQPQ